MSCRNRRESYLNRPRQCLSCQKLSLNFFGDELLKCSHCERYQYKEIGLCKLCELKICTRCLVKYSEIQEEKFKSRTKQSKTTFSINCMFLSALILPLSAVIVYLVFLSWKIPEQVLTPMDNLCPYFPSQKRETWLHIFSVLDMKFPTVKSLTLLHSKDDKTTECLLSKLVMVYTNDNNIKIKDISFENTDQEVRDYGEVLEYYRPIVEKHGIFVADLNKISGNIARIFHSLCDEISSPIKPSLFIFMLRYNENVKHLKPLTRATTILKEEWQSLPDNELFPLLSRVVKNVVDVIPEKQIKC